MSVHFNVNTSTLQVMQAEGHHKAHLSHEIIAAAASYEVCDPLDHQPSSFVIWFSFLSLLLLKAMKAYHKHCEKNGKPVSHAQAKEIL